MNQAPDILEIDHGVLQLINKPTVTGEDTVEEYLDTWQRRNGLPNGTEVCIITRESLDNLIVRQHMNTCA
jgi:hypothetical protein